MLPAHFMVGGNFSLRTLRMSAEIASSAAASAASSASSTAEDDPLLVAFENALAIAELALRVVEDAHRVAIEEAHGGDALGDGMPVRAGIAVDRGAHPSGNAGERLQPLEPVLVGKIDQILKHRSGRRP